MGRGRGVKWTEKDLAAHLAKFSPNMARFGQKSAPKSAETKFRVSPAQESTPGTRASTGGGAGAVPRPNKFGAVRTQVDGIWFDSGKEARRYVELKALAAAGDIYGLEWDKKMLRYALDVDGTVVGYYVADFRYLRGTDVIVEDVKGGSATKTPAYKLKRRLMKAIYDIEITEV